VPSLRDEADELLARITALHAEQRPPRPVNGAPHPTARLVDGDRLGLIDFERPALGTAAFLGGVKREAAAAFVRGYGDLDERRLGLSPRARAREGAQSRVRPSAGRARASGAAAPWSRRALSTTGSSSTG
jgi:hypothetical protein